MQGKNIFTIRISAMPRSTTSTNLQQNWNVKQKSEQTKKYELGDLDRNWTDYSFRQAVLPSAARPEVARVASVRACARSCMCRQHQFQTSISNINFHQEKRQLTDAIVHKNNTQLTAWRNQQKFSADCIKKPSSTTKTSADCMEKVPTWLHEETT